jgi:hypothetical protein
MWQKALSATEYSWEDAKAFCPTERTGGYTDWRLPTLIELTAIIDHGRTGPVVDPTYFSWKASSWGVWSSSPSATSSTEAWMVYLDYADTGPSSRTTSFNITCVR